MFEGCCNFAGRMALVVYSDKRHLGNNYGSLKTDGRLGPGNALSRVIPSGGRHYCPHLTARPTQATSTLYFVFLTPKLYNSQISSLGAR